MIRTKSLFNCNADQYWSDSRLPWLDIVLFCSDRVQLKWVYWAVRYLDRPQWVQCCFWWHVCAGHCDPYGQHRLKEYISVIVGVGGGWFKFKGKISYNLVSKEMSSSGSVIGYGRCRGTFCWKSLQCNHTRIEDWCNSVIKAFQ